MDSRLKDRENLSRLQSTNKDLILSAATSKRLQRLAVSLGFNDAFEAQAAIDATDLDFTYRQFTETIRAQQAELMMLRKELELAQKENTALKKGLWNQELNSFPLDADTAGYLFTFLPDLPSLISMTHSCRFLYNVFRAGHQAITSAVALNQIGPALPQALRLARTEIAGLRQAKVGDLPTEDLVLSVPALGITGRDSVILARNAEVVTELENIFSWKNKDRKSTTSVLTEQESFRFQRALYRIMLLCFVYGMDSISESEMFEEFEEGYPFMHLEKYHLNQEHFLEEYPTSELCEIQRVALFLQHLASIRRLEDISFESVENMYDLAGLTLFAGPCFILQCYKYCKSYKSVCKYLDDRGLYTGFVTIPLQKVWSERDEPVMDISMSILDSIHGVEDLCTKCNFRHPVFTGVNLVNDTCWGDLKGHFQEYVSLWSRNLLSNAREVDELRETLHSTLHNLDYRTFMDTLFDARSGRYNDWRKDEWICRDCLTSLWIDTLSIWWFERPG